MTTYDRIDAQLDRLGLEALAEFSNLSDGWTSWIEEFVLYDIEGVYTKDGTYKGCFLEYAELQLEQRWVSICDAFEGMQKANGLKGNGYLN